MTCYKICGSRNKSTEIGKSPQKIKIDCRRQPEQKVKSSLKLIKAKKKEIDKPENRNTQSKKVYKNGNDTRSSRF